MDFSEKEISLMMDIDFVRTKSIVMNKILEMFSHIRDDLKKMTSFSPDGNFPIAGGKISRGENYRQLPYVVLDCPGHFSRHHIFAFRTMFWWGHFFSATLHLQGNYLEQYRQKIEHSISKLSNSAIYISVGDTPWEYHYEPDNYIPLSLNHLPHIRNAVFLKFSQRYELTSWETVPEKVLRFYSLLLDVLEGH